MNYHGIETDSMVNGDGLRVVLWVAGCTHHCKDCQNPQTHNPNGGEKFTFKSLKLLIKELSKPYIQGLTLSGGDPLYPENRIVVGMICVLVKFLFKNKKDIWVYTGYTYEEVRKLNLLKYIDVLVDGEFIKELQDNNLEWVGSSNQRVIRLHNKL